MQLVHLQLAISHADQPLPPPPPPPPTHLPHTRAPFAQCCILSLPFPARTRFILRALTYTSPWAAWRRRQCRRPRTAHYLHLSRAGIFTDSDPDRAHNEPSRSAGPPLQVQVCSWRRTACALYRRARASLAHYRHASGGCSASPGTTEQLAASYGCYARPGPARPGRTRALLEQ